MDQDPPAPTAGLPRRALLSSAIGGGIAATLGGGRAAAATISPRPDPAPLTAQTTEGPYYLPLDLIRADIREGRPGIALDIVFSVFDQTGAPYLGASVDIWHCDSAGAYSGFAQPGEKAGSGETFLRGTQLVDRHGLVTFHSLYPGWYPGRTPHIHFKVRRAGLTNLTSQFFLPDALSEFLYTQAPAYRRDALRDTLNSQDGIAIEAGDTVLGNVREGDGRYIASLTVRADRSANPPIDRPPSPPPGPPPGFWHDGAGGPPPMPDALQGEARIAALLPDAPREARHPGPPPPGPTQSRHGSAKD